MSIIYGSIFSPYVRKVLTVLHFKNIFYDLQFINPFLPEDRKELLQLNPLGKVPVYQEDDFILADSSVISAYLEKKHPTPSLYPVDSKDYALSLWYEEYADTALMSAIVTISLNKLVAPKLGLPVGDKALAHALDISLPEIFTYLDKEIGKNKYLVGSEFSIADVSIWPAFLNYQLCGYSIDKNRWENLANYVDSIFLEPCIATLIEQTNKEFKLRF